MIKKEDINLLPAGAKRWRAQVLYLNRIGRLLRVFVFLAVVAAVALAVVWVGELRVRQTAAEQVVAAGSGGAEVAARVQEVNEFVRAFHARATALEALSPRVGALMRIVPPGVRLTGLEVTRDEAPTLEVEGVAGGTEVLVAFQRALERLPGVTAVEAPLQNFATEPRGEFSFTLRLDN